MPILRFLLALIIVAISVSPVAAQEVSQTPDTALVHGGEMQDEASFFGDTVRRLGKGDTVLVHETKEDYVQVSYQGEKGWMSERQVMTPDEEKEYRQKLKGQRQRARERRQYLQSLREKGYTIVLTRQTFDKNSADGISVGLGLVNISDDKTVKYVKITWKLFNSVGDPTAGDNSGSATAQTRLVGPVKPEESGYTEFDNVWYNSVGTCAQVQRIEVEHIDGSSFVYVSDLKEIAQEAATVRLQGDCSYEAQQERKN